jgi:hypothetical protein
MRAQSRQTSAGRGRGRRVSRLLIAALASVALIAAWLGGGADAARQVGESTYGAILRDRVDNHAGGPHQGHDPSAQPQQSLAAAASAPNDGIGAWGVKPARGVGSGNARHRPGQVLPHRSAEGVTSGGCSIAYGTPGRQCVPGLAPGDRPQNCAYLVRLFAHGVRVRSGDPLGLDRNRDDIACGPGDAR